MAGFYPDVPANRLAYHLDGTVVLLKDSSNGLTDITGSSVNLNDEDASSLVYATPYNAVIFLFPALRNIQAYFASYDRNASSFNPGTLQASSDTTNGLDGTWSTVVNPWVVTENSVVPDYRNSIDAGAASMIKALRFNYTHGGYSYNLRALHLYGTIPLTENPDRLIFWEPINNNETPGPYFDWGDIPRGTASTKQFRIRNNSATQVANSITISASAATYTMAVEFSTDNVSFASSINIGNLASGATSSILYVRRTVPAGEPLRVQAVRMSAVAGSWT